MRHTLRPTPVAITKTTWSQAQFTASLAQPPPARLGPDRLVASDNGMPLHLAKLPSLAPTPSAPHNAARDAPSPGCNAAQSTALLRLQFEMMRRVPQTEWTSLCMAAFKVPRTLFNLAVHKAAPAWDAGMIEAFLTETDFERWTMLPRALEVASVLHESACTPLRALPYGNNMPALQTPLQYEVHRPVEYDLVFDRLKREYGSKFFFHGSPIQNWHQILTQGLEPKSGTAMQVNGANNGYGLYVADTSTLSATFMGATAMRVLGIVEVISHPSVWQQRNAYIVPSRVLAAVRFIAVYKDNNVVPDIDAQALRGQIAIAQMHERDPRFQWRLLHAAAVARP